MINEKELRKFIGKSDKDIESEFGFTYYIETKDSMFLIPKVDEDKLVDMFFDFIGKPELFVVKTYDGEIEDVFKIENEKIKENYKLFNKNKGEFYDDDYCVAYSVLSENFYCSILGDTLMFSSNEETVNKFAEILDKNNIKYHEIDTTNDNIESPEEFEREVLEFLNRPAEPRKTGRNEPCPCGSGKKYKKCCIEKK